ncbi:hypothetical protein BY996DRAFT_372554 [Phakopsora pachyrhizi]|nr:hypothetical protein BY996DRAFT_372554 [Phakopsora pachyrhizi]
MLHLLYRLIITSVSLISVAIPATVSTTFTPCYTFKRYEANYVEPSSATCKFPDKDNQTYRYSCDLPVNQTVCRTIALNITIGPLAPHLQEKDRVLPISFSQCYLSTDQSREIVAVAKVLWYQKKVGYLKYRFKLSHFFISNRCEESQWRNLLLQHKIQFRTKDCVRFV